MRSEQTESSTVSVRVCGLDSDGRVYQRQAQASDVGRYAACLTGIASLTRPGEIIEVEHQGKAHFQVVWADVEHLGGNEQIGILSLEPDTDVWGIEAEQRKWTNSTQTGRAHKRHTCAGTVRIINEAKGSTEVGQIRDVSLGGCFVVQASPIPVGTAVALNLDICGQRIDGKGSVVNSSKVGIGISFANLEPAEAVKLLLAVRMLSVAIVER
jgi:hypothetical protein